MKYPEKLHLEMPYHKDLLIDKDINSPVSMYYFFTHIIGKKIKISRDPNHPRSGVYYKVSDIKEYGKSAELVLKRVYPQTEKNAKNN